MRVAAARWRGHVTLARDTANVRVTSEWIDWKRAALLLLLLLLLDVTLLLLTSAFK